ncbi:MAG: MCE family protein [Bdellovibrio sp. CG10_big_fil_rev_8_21_14_0_10_47_8]|nr:MAG: MCE family protein [Bdellovibrio sp. CG10_big_fil_rev_8_21_14_0_10_47_8]
MNLLKAAEFKVGLLVVTVASLIAYMSMQVSDDPSYFGRSNEAWFMLPDAAGLVKGSQVKSAGIPVGIIKKISLQDGQARLDLSLKSDFKLYVSAAVEIKSQGILGDKHVAIYPGSPTDPPLAKGGQILNVKDKGSLDNVVAQIGEISSSLKGTAEALKEAVTEDGTRKHILGRIISNIEKLTQDISEITSENKGKVGQIVDRFNNITRSLDELLNDNGEDSLKSQLKRTVARMDSAMKNVDEITGKINRGEGTIGRLINDEETVEELNTAIDGVNGFLDTAGKTQTALDFHADYLGEIGKTKTTVGIKLQPGLDRYYYLGIVDDPAGVVEETDTTTITDGGPGSTTNEVKTYKNKVKFNALFAKTFWDLTVKGGLIENSGGVGFEYNIYRNKVIFSMDAFEFSSLNLRAQLQYNFWKGIYVLGGVSDALDKQQKRSNYFGAGLFLTNDDLKLLMTKMPLN